MSLENYIFSGNFERPGKIYLHLKEFFKWACLSWEFKRHSKIESQNAFIEKANVGDEHEL